MDFSFYALLTLACLVLVLAMWACAASSTTKWGPDLTLELPPHLWQEVLFGRHGSEEAPKQRKYKITRPAPSAPCELPSAPLLCNEVSPGLSGALKPSIRPPVPPKGNAETMVRVLPSHFIPSQKNRHNVAYAFNMQEQV